MIYFYFWRVLYGVVWCLPRIGWAPARCGDKGRRIRRKIPVPFCISGIAVKCAFYVGVTLGVKKEAGKNLFAQKNYENGLLTVIRRGRGGGGRIARQSEAFFQAPNSRGSGSVKPVPARHAPLRAVVTTTALSSPPPSSLVVTSPAIPLAVPLPEPSILAVDLVDSAVCAVSFGHCRAVGGCRWEGGAKSSGVEFILFLFVC